MGTVAHYLEVDVPAEKAYAWWRGLTTLPSVMPDVESITAGGPDGTTTHWKVHGPLGKSVEWDARIVEDVPNEKIAWASVGGGKTLAPPGAVRLDDHGGSPGGGGSFSHDPPAGGAGGGGGPR